MAKQYEGPVINPEPRVTDIPLETSPVTPVVPTVPPPVDGEPAVDSDVVGGTKVVINPDLVAKLFRWKDIFLIFSSKYRLHRERTKSKGISTMKSVLISAVIAGASVLGTHLYTNNYGVNDKVVEGDGTAKVVGNDADYQFKNYKDRNAVRYKNGNKIEELTAEDRKLLIDDLVKELQRRKIIPADGSADDNNGDDNDNDTGGGGDNDGSDSGNNGGNDNDNDNGADDSDNDAGNDKPDTPDVPDAPDEGDNDGNNGGNTGIPDLGDAGKEALALIKESCVKCHSLSQPGGGLSFVDNEGRLDIRHIDSHLSPSTIAWQAHWATFKGTMPKKGPDLTPEQVKVFEDLAEALTESEKLKDNVASSMKR